MNCQCIVGQEVDMQEAVDEWTKSNPQGYVMTVLSDDKATLHRAGCCHTCEPCEAEFREARFMLCGNDLAELRSQLDFAPEECKSCQPFPA